VLTASPPTPAMLNAFREGMREHGYIEGQNLSLAVRWPQGSFDQDPGIVTELVSGNVDVIVAWATPTVIAARRATSTIPIVMVSVNDPIRSGFITSLARPGGNITGLSAIVFDLSAKLVELFVELIPGMKLVGVVRNPSNPAVTLSLRETEDAVRKLNMQVQSSQRRPPRTTAGSIGKSPVRYGRNGLRSTSRWPDSPARDCSVERPIERGDDDRHDECPDQHDQAEGPEVTELVAARPVDHQAHTVGERGQEG
jgi:hypothetical protein